MKQVPSADFRKSYTREQDVIEVTAYDSPIGYWIPITHPAAALVETADVFEAEAQAEEPTTRMTIRPVKAGGRVLVATEKRVLDPLEMRERVKAEEAARFGKPLLGRRLSRPQ